MMTSGVSVPFTLDPQIASALAASVGQVGDTAPPAVGDVATRRQNVAVLMAQINSRLVEPDDVSIHDYETTAEDGSTLLLRWYTKDGTAPGSAVLYLHGGGMIMCDVALYDIPVARYVSTTGVPFLSVEYRYAPEHPAPTPVTDSYAGLRWLAEHAVELGVDPARIAIMGDSGGGGVAASLAIYNRDHNGPQVAQQILIYPMLDDRTSKPDPELAPFLTWSYGDNVTGWGALLGDAVGGPDVTPYGAPARLSDFRSLPPAFIEVGELDIFRDESIAYAQRLLSAGVSTELHVHRGAPHGSEAVAPESDVAQRIMADRHRTLQAF
jgi:acetyl esterase/lipase